MRYPFFAILILFCTAFNPHNKKVEYLADVIYAEAGGESIEAKTAVATVIWERSGHSESKIYSIITAPKHFASPKKEEVEEYKDCINLAKEMYRGEFKSVMVSLPDKSLVYPDHFYHGKSPYWAKGKMYAKVGNLKFIRLAKEESD